MEVKKRLARKVKFLKKSPPLNLDLKFTNERWTVKLKDMLAEDKPFPWIGFSDQTQIEPLFKIGMEPLVSFTKEAPFEVKIEDLVSENRKVETQLPHEDEKSTQSVERAMIKIPDPTVSSVSIKIDLFSTEVALDDYSVEFLFLRKDPILHKKSPRARSTAANPDNLNQNRTENPQTSLSQDMKRSSVTNPPFELKNKAKVEIKPEDLAEFSYIRKRKLVFDEKADLEKQVDGSSQGSRKTERNLNQKVDTPPEKTPAFLQVSRSSSSSCGKMPKCKITRTPSNFISFSSRNGLKKIFHCYKDSDVNKFVDSKLEENIHDTNMDHDCESTESLIDHAISAVVRTLKNHIQKYHKPSSSSVVKRVGGRIVNRSKLDSSTQAHSQVSLPRPQNSESQVKSMVPKGDFPPSKQEELNQADDTNKSKAPEKTKSECPLEYKSISSVLLAHPLKTEGGGSSTPSPDWIQIEDSSWSHPLHLKYNNLFLKAKEQRELFNKKHDELIAAKNAEKSNNQEPVKGKEKLKKGIKGKDKQNENPVEKSPIIKK